MTKDVLFERWRAIEGISEPLARMAGLAGRWGDGTEVHHLQDAVQMLTADRPGNGNTALIGIVSYPAYLTFLTYGLGLTKAERWQELFRWLTMPIRWSYREPMPAATSLFMFFWHDTEPDWWKHWPGLENRRTAWADHLVDVAVPWSRDYGLVGEAALENYHTLELLGGFAALTDQQEESLANLQDFTWMPYGQTMWKSDARTRILGRLEQPDLQRRLLAAGFSKGSATHWAGVVRNIDFLSRKVGW